MTDKHEIIPVPPSNEINITERVRRLEERVDALTGGQPIDDMYVFGDLARLGIAVTQVDGVLVLTFQSTDQGRWIGQHLVGLGAGARHYAIADGHSNTKVMAAALKTTRERLRMSPPGRCANCTLLHSECACGKNAEVETCEKCGLDNVITDQHECSPIPFHVTPEAEEQVVKLAREAERGRELACSEQRERVALQNQLHRVRHLLDGRVKPADLGITFNGWIDHVERLVRAAYPLSKGDTTVPTQAEIEAIWAELHVMPTGADMTNECRLAAACIRLRQDLANARLVATQPRTIGMHEAQLVDLLTDGRSVLGMELELLSAKDIEKTCRAAAAVIRGADERGVPAIGQIVKTLNTAFDRGACVADGYRTALVGMGSKKNLSEGDEAAERTRTVWSVEILKLAERLLSGQP